VGVLLRFQAAALIEDLAARDVQILLPVAVAVWAEEHAEWCAEPARADRNEVRPAIARPGQRRPWAWTGRPLEPQDSSVTDPQGVIRHVEVPVGSERQPGRMI